MDDAESGRLASTHPLWNTPRLKAAVEGDQPGTVVRLVREAVGWTQEELGARYGCSGSTICRLEAGGGLIDDTKVRRRLADILGIPAHYLGLSPSRVARPGTSGAGVARPPSPPVTLRGSEISTPGGTDLRRRTLLTGAAATALTGLANPTTTPHGLEKMLFAGAHPGTPLSSHDAAALLTRASQAYHAARYATLTHALPSLLSGLHAAHTQASDHVRETFAVMLVRAYVLASSVCTKLGDDAIAWVLADRALSTARQVDDSAALASATHTVAIAMRREGHHDGALTLLTSTAEGLNADRGAAPDALLGAYGNLLCTAAYSAAQAGNAGAATTYLDEATAAAARLQAPTRGVIPFSPTTVAIYKIGVYTAAGDTAAALQAAATVESHQLPTAERYGRYLLDTARAWTAHDRPAQAVQALLAAEQHAPGEVDRPSVRELVSRLLYAPTATPAGLRDLATRIGAAV